MDAKTFPFGAIEEKGSKQPESVGYQAIGAINGENAPGKSDTSAYIYRILEMLESMGLSPRSAPWRATLFCLFMSIIIWLPGLAVGLHLGNLRYSLGFMFWSFANNWDVVNIPLMVRAAPDLIP